MFHISLLVFQKQISDLKSENDALNEKLKSEEQKRISREKANFKKPSDHVSGARVRKPKAVLKIKNERLCQPVIE